jgi:hypothetical protein
MEMVEQGSAYLIFVEGSEYSLRMSGHVGGFLPEKESQITA